MRTLLVVALTVALAAGSATTAHGAPTTETTIVQGSVIRLESVQDPAAMASMTPGTSVLWDVGVSTSEPAGTLTVTLESVDRAPAFSVSVRACDGNYASGSCSGQESTLAVDVTPGGLLQLTTQDAAASAWYRVEVSLVDAVQHAEVQLVFRAAGVGESVESDGAVWLPTTGADIVPALWLALAAIVLGIVVAALARARRDRA